MTAEMQPTATMFMRSTSALQAQQFVIMLSDI